ncbi:MAG TPA: ABC transporter permease [Thermoleophilia bacterium]|nr:ABC transporter permease [Thermoleophilia bacterium]
MSVAERLETRRSMDFRPARAAALGAFWALLLRDLRVLQKTIVVFAVRTIMQPFLLVFVFTYVFPKIGQGVGGTARSEADFSTLLMAGVVATSMIFQGVQAVALPLVQEFGFTREIEDRVMSPMPVWGVALEKIAAGAVQALIAGLVVFPLAAVIPATPVHLHIHWLVLLTVAPIAAVLSAALGLTMGTRVKPQQVPLLFAIVVLPITFLGAVYYPWTSLAPIRWLQVIVLVNPLVYMCEGFRLALTREAQHMPIWAIYTGMIAFTVVLMWVGIDGFRRRVLS